MSQQNVEIVRRMYDAFNAGDYQTSLNLMSPDIEYHELADMPGAGQGVGVYRGHEELAQWYSEFLSQWESLESVPGEITELEADRVLVVETWRGRGASSVGEKPPALSGDYCGPMRCSQARIGRSFADWCVRL